MFSLGTSSSPGPFFTPSNVLALPPPTPPTPLPARKSATTLMFRGARALGESGLNCGSHGGVINIRGIIRIKSVAAQNGAATPSAMLMKCSSSANVWVELTAVGNPERCRTV